MFHSLFINLLEQPNGALGIQACVFKHRQHFLEFFLAVFKNVQLVALHVALDGHFQDGEVGHLQVFALLQQFIIRHNDEFVTA